MDIKRKEVVQYIIEMTGEEMGMLLSELDHIEDFGVILGSPTINRFYSKLCEELKIPTGTD